MMDMHNHTTWSYDSENSPEALIDNAARNGIKLLGISDHHRSVLMGYSDRNKLKNYIKNINELKFRYFDRLDILCGLEINVNFHQDELENLPYDLMKGLDYVILEHLDGTGLFGHVTPYCMKLKDVQSIVSKLNCRRIGVAHTDLFYLSREVYDEGKGFEHGADRVAKMLSENNLFWEINIQSHYKYFDYMEENPESPEIEILFEKLQKYGVKASAASDSHLHLWDFYLDRIIRANEMAASIGRAFKI